MNKIQNQNQNQNHKVYMSKLNLNILNACKDDDIDINIDINPGFTIEIDEEENLIKVVSKRNQNVSTSVLYEGYFFIPYFEELKEKDISKKLIEKFIHYAYTVEIYKYL